ncbi:MAG TPA: alpha-amylase/4-alpha-glucanotransferase domain-containing protein [Planctomycetota bacterium]|nr:alpha-amylase/4-alpha-glucanotransferase domain-containing protein [Planctomycetota bacterium]
MPGRVRFVCLLHSHQPVGNFDHVIEEACNLSYIPYVEAFEKHPRIPLTHHMSGCLLEWLGAHHPEYLDRLALRVKGEGGAKKWEMVGGAFYEPIMPLLPTRDRIGQIKRMQDFNEKRFGARPRSFWLAERVWEPALVKDLADAGVEYLTLDDSHFRAAGLEDKELTGGFITEDQGRILTVYPASEKLRYMIPFATVEDTIAYLRGLIPAGGERVVCYADDGEKFGVWPHTFKHVYSDGWLDKFLTALEAAQEEGWLVCSTLQEAYDEIEAAGQVCIPENSYREMTEWALPARRLAAYDRAMHAIKVDEKLKDDERIKAILPLIKGGNWRSFKIKYAEGGRMYAKMMEVSEKVEAMPQNSMLREKALTHLYRGQCNCPYWHGVFGGMYLPHLRSAVYSELIKADKVADEVRARSPLNRDERDFDFDGEAEFKLSNERVALYLHPRRGGHLYEYDLREIAFNAGDTFSRRYEAYHDKVALAKLDSEVDHDASIHERIVAKEVGLERLLKYDAYLRESLIDHVSARPLTPALLSSGQPPSDPGFRAGRYEARPVNLLRGEVKLLAVELIRRAKYNGAILQIAKRVTLGVDSTFDVDYVVEHCGGNAQNGFFAVEMNYSLLAGDAYDRYFFHADSINAGKLATEADFGTMSFAGLKDEWLNVELTLRTSKPAQFLVAPVKTVSQSEGGFESVYQSSSMVLQWPLRLEEGQRFTVSLKQETGRVR